VKFAEPLWLFGTLFALVVAVVFIAGGIGLRRATRRFGDPDRVKELVTSQASRPRAWKGLLIVLATALAFTALARPQYGRGTRLVPATNLDVVIVLDYSKSMYARDIVPSRIARAKAEVARLVRELSGARFGAVAFAGEPIGFPMTSDGAAIAQFFRQLEPNDMPVGGTAIARALEKARELLARDPKSQNHNRVILLVTDGEDLEGDPVAVAQSAANEGTSVHVVQIGGRTPEVIPEVAEDGSVIGIRKDTQGQPLTTSLSAEGEAQLGRVAEVASGQIIRSERGSTGIETITAELKRKMTEELAERIETVYADVYTYPLGLAILLLVLEAFVSEARRRKAVVAKTKASAALLSLFVVAFALAGCNWDPSRPFDRLAPEVEGALADLDAGAHHDAAATLQAYLQTGPCENGAIGTSDRVRQLPNASFDLGIALFHIGEQFGKPFGDEELGREDEPSPEEQQLAGLRWDQVECALRIALAIADDASNPAELRARAFYLAGNLEFLRRQYEAAVRHYDKALKLIPGFEDGGDSVGRDAAHNRAIALRRIEEENERDAGADADDEDASDSPDAGDDASDEEDQPDGSDGDSGSDDDAGADDAGEADSGSDSDGEDDGGSSEDAGGQQDQPQEQEPQAQDEPQPQPSEPPKANDVERMLDMFEAAPTFQQQDAKNRAQTIRLRRGMVDK